MIGVPSGGTARLESWILITLLSLLGLFLFSRRAVVFFLPYSQIYKQDKYVYLWGTGIRECSFEKWHMDENRPKQRKWAGFLRRGKKESTAIAPQRRKASAARWKNKMLVVFSPPLSSPPLRALSLSAGIMTELVVECEWAAVEPPPLLPSSPPAPRPPPPCQLTD